MKQLPLKFKLLSEGKMVGYEKHEDLHDCGMGIEVWHSRDGENWSPSSASLRSCSTRFLVHDEKHQSTGYRDKNGEEIYFRDELMRQEEPERKFKVEFYVLVGQIYAVFKSQAIYSQNFKYMELVK
jgi:hypothetical protein